MKRSRWWGAVLLTSAAALGGQGCLFHRGGTIGDITSITAREIDSVHAIDAYDAV